MIVINISHGILQCYKLCALARVTLTLHQAGACALSCRGTDRFLHSTLAHFRSKHTLLWRQQHHHSPASTLQQLRGQPQHASNRILVLHIEQHAVDQAVMQEGTGSPIRTHL